MFPPAPTETCPKQTAMAVPEPRELSQSHDYEITEPPVPLLGRHGNASVISEAETATSNMPSPAPTVAKSCRQGKKEPANGLEKHREQLISLFWIRDLPLKEVQTIMKRQHGLDIR